MQMDEANMDNWLESHHYTFVNYYAPWCVWCQRLEPVWEAFAERIGNEDLPVSVVKVDCIANMKLCSDQRVMVSSTSDSLIFCLFSAQFLFKESAMYSYCDFFS